MSAEHVRIDPVGIYDDLALYQVLSISTAALAQGRRSGDLRHTRRGNRTLYLGQWVLDWLLAAARGGKEVTCARAHNALPLAQLVSTEGLPHE
jgi:hypothetical protein